MPQGFPVTGRKTQLTRLGKFFGRAAGAQIGQQLATRAFIIGVRAGIDVAYAATCGQTDVPDPAVFLRHRMGLRGNRSVVPWIRHLDRQRRIVEKHLALGAQRNTVVLAQQQGGHAGAVDEQIGFQQAIQTRAQAGNVAIVGGIDPVHVIKHMTDAELVDAVLAQENPKLAGVQVIAVVGDRSELRRLWLLGRKARVTQGGLIADHLGKRSLSMPTAPLRDQIGLGVALGKDEGVIVVMGRIAIDPAAKAGALLE